MPENQPASIINRLSVYLNVFTKLISQFLQFMVDKIPVVAQ